MSSWRARRRCGGIPVLACLVLLFAGATQAWAQAGRSRAFDVPASPMADALNLFAKQAGVRVLFSYDLVAGRRAGPVRGRMSAEEALARLLKNSGLRVVDRRDDVIILHAASPRAPPTPPPPPPPPGRAVVAEVVVNGQARFGRGQLEIGATDTATASVSGFGQDLIRNMAVANPADLFRVLPGFQVSDFGQGPVAQGMALRGWTTIADGQDVAFFLDGAPRNQVSGANSNGYLDINPVIPDTIGQVTVVRGPFDIRYGGNLALGASILAETRAAMPVGLSLSANGFGNVRALGALPLKIDDGSGYVALDAQRLDGYRDNSKGYTLNLFSRLGAPAPGGRGVITLQGYRTDFGKPSYLRLDDLQAGRVDRRAAVDDTDGNRKTQFTATYHYTGAQGGTLIDAHGFADRAIIRSATNFGGGDGAFPQYIYRDARWVFGGDIEARRPFAIGSSTGDLRLGAISRIDRVHSRRAPGFGGVSQLDPSPLDALYFARGDFTQTNLAAYAAFDVKPLASLKLSGGVRYDTFFYDIDNQLYDPAAAGRRATKATESADAVTFKFGAALQVAPAISLFANYGQSIRAPSALTDAPINTEFRIARLHSEELGVAFAPEGLPLRANLNVFQTRLTNEIGYANFLPLNNGPSRRNGLDASLDAVLLNRGGFKLAASANYSLIDAKLLRNPNGTHVRQVAKWQGGYTLEATTPGFVPRDYVVVRLDHGWIGPQPLTIAGDIRTETYDRIALKVAYHAPEARDLTLWLSAIAYPHDRLSETSYVFGGSRFVSPMPPLRLETGVSIGF